MDIKGSTDVMTEKSHFHLGKSVAVYKIIEYYKLVFMYKSDD